MFTINTVQTIRERYISKDQNKGHIMFSYFKELYFFTST